MLAKLASKFLEGMEWHHVSYVSVVLEDNNQVMVTPVVYLVSQKYFSYI